MWQDSPVIPILFRSYCRSQYRPFPAFAIVGNVRAARETPTWRRTSMWRVIAGSLPAVQARIILPRVFGDSFCFKCFGCRCCVVRAYPHLPRENFRHISGSSENHGSDMSTWSERREGRHCNCGKCRMSYPHWPPTCQSEAVDQLESYLSMLNEFWFVTPTKLRGQATCHEASI